jgi:predicted nucleotidyltransferase
LQNAVARDRVSQALKEEHIKKSILVAMNSFDKKYSSFDKNSIIIDTRDSLDPDLEKELIIDMNLHGYPMRELTGVLAEMLNIVKDYDKVNHRNNKKDELHLNKHAMHLLRLYIMCLDILLEHKVVTYREKEHDLLMSVRNGEFMNEDGTFKAEFFKIVDDYELKVKQAMEISTLPENPDYEKVNEFVMKINRKGIEELYG